MNHPNCGSLKGPTLNFLKKLHRCQFIVLCAVAPKIELWLRDFAGVNTQNLIISKIGDYRDKDERERSVWCSKSRNFLNTNLQLCCL